jgi:hypothetical protein
MKTIPPLQKILKGILYIEEKNEHSHEMTGIIKHKEKSRQVIRE